MPIVAEFGFMWFPDVVLAILFKRRYMYTSLLEPVKRFRNMSHSFRELYNMMY